MLFFEGVKESNHLAVHTDCRFSLRIERCKSMDRFSLGNKTVVVVNALVFEAFLKPKSLFLEKVLFPGADIARGG